MYPSSTPPSTFQYNITHRKHALKKTKIPSDPTYDLCVSLFLCHSALLTCACALPVRACLCVTPPVAPLTTRILSRTPTNHLLVLSPLLPHIQFRPSAAAELTVQYKVLYQLPAPTETRRTRSGQTRQRYCDSKVEWSVMYLTANWKTSEL